MKGYHRHKVQGKPKHFNMEAYELNTYISTP
jgi:hypothetical protein